MFKSILFASAIAATAAIAQAGEQHIVNFDDVDWQPAGLEGAEMAVLWGSEEESSAIWAFRLQPGVAIPAHTHSGTYRGFAIQGNWVHIDAEGQEEVTAQEAFAVIEAGELHADRCAGPGVCINILDFEGARDIAFPE
ncbi:hypothetical protein RA19_02440 [Leisingera sp. ANG-M1]|uniref:cupin domain-containing protein n=1 Tax=Leisingera sp. ANG-M1 TaxID=1577895 RepID=UPI000580A15C|nr:hypothetical protein [Leisingera sp. ANG-M1]KIC12128.1 hypothetical protein RA19_02440 [Leisingera sp. ANG-M1]